MYAERECSSADLVIVGFEPSSVTYTSDNLQRLYEKAEKLIELGKAYVCHCDKEGTKKQMGASVGKEGPRYRCEHAEQTAEINGKSSAT